MYEIRWSARFQRDVRRSQRQNKPMDKFKAIDKLLVAGKSLPQETRITFLPVTGEDTGSVISNQTGF